MRTSLRGHVAAATLAAVTLTMVAVLSVVVSTFARSERHDLDRRVVDRANATARAATVPPRPQQRPPGAPPAPSLFRRIEQAVAQGGESARLLRDGAVLDTFGAPIPAGDGFPSPHGTNALQTVTVGGVHYRAIALDIHASMDDGTQATLRLEVASAMTDVESRISDLRRRVLLIGMAGLLLAAGTALLLGRLALRSLERLRSRVAVVRDPAHPEARIPGGGPREVEELADTVNAMLDRIAATGAARDAALEASRRFAADVGHELRTPLAAISANVATLLAHPRLDATERGAIIAALADDERRLTDLLAALQALARGDAAEAVARGPVDVADLADAAVAAARRRHPGLAITFNAPEGDAATISGWDDGLRLAIDNLIENAAAHGGSGGRLEVAVDARGSAGPVVVTVDDAGPGIPAGERDAVRGRFVRGSGARGPGSGLGLALALQQAELHGGVLEIADAPLGGARVRMRLARDAGALGEPDRQRVVGPEPHGQA